MKNKIYALAILILSPVTSLPQETSPAEKIRTSKEYQNTLSLFKEPQIFPASNPNVEVYRIFIWPTFYHAISIRVERNGKAYELVAKYTSGQVGYGAGTLEGERRRRLTEKEWQRLLDLLNRASFWSLPSNDKEPEPNERGEVTICLDNTDWFLEGVSGGRRHFVDRYCPESQDFKAVGLYMVRLSKLRISERALH